MKKEDRIKNIACKSWVIKKLQECESKLSKVLADDEEFYGTIVEGCLLVGKPHPRTGDIIDEDTIKNWVLDKYPDLYFNPEFEGKEEILNIIYNLTKLINGTHLLVRAGLARIYEQDVQEGLNFYKTSYLEYRKHIEETIIKTLYPGDLEDNKEVIDISGSINNIDESMNNMMIGEVTEQMDEVE